MARRAELKVKAGLGQHGHRMEKIFQEIPAQNKKFDTKPGLKTDCYISFLSLSHSFSPVLSVPCVWFSFFTYKETQCPLYFIIPSSAALQTALTFLQDRTLLLLEAFLLNDLNTHDGNWQRMFLLKCNMETIPSLKCNFKSQVSKYMRFCGVFLHSSWWGQANKKGERIMKDAVTLKWLPQSTVDWKYLKNLALAHPNVITKYSYKWWIIPMALGYWMWSSMWPIHLTLKKLHLNDNFFFK